MRISIIEGDSGYNTWQNLNKAVVFLDGCIVQNVITADEMLGFVLVYAKDGFGKYFLDETHKLATEKKHGHVVITFK